MTEHNTPPFQLMAHLRGNRRIDHCTQDCSPLLLIGRMPSPMLTPLCLLFCIQGLALLYDNATKADRSKLVNSLLDTFQTGKREGASTGRATAPPAEAATSTETSSTSTAANSDVSGIRSGSAARTGLAGTMSGPSGMGLTASGDTAYRELCDMATDMGQPDLIYRFLALASHNAMWHAKGGAAVGLSAFLNSSARSQVRNAVQISLPLWVFLSMPHDLRL